MSTTRAAAPEDLQAARPRTPISLSRVGVAGVEKIIRIRAQNGAERASSTPTSSASSTSTPSQKGVHMSRFEEVGQRGDRRRRPRRGAARRGAGRAHRRECVERQGGPAREVKIAPATRRRAHAGLRHPHPGDLHPLRHRRRLRPRHPPPDRRRGPGHDRLPVRPGAGRGQAPATRLGPTGSATTTSTASSTRSHRHPQPARRRHPLHRRARGRRTWTPTPLLCDRRGAHVVRDLRADEARRRAVRGREGPRRPPLRRGLRPRDDPPGRSSGFPELRDGAFVHARQENLETIHRHNVVAERSATLGEIRRELSGGEHVSRHTTLRAWLDGCVPTPG